MRLLIKNGTVVNSYGVHKADVLAEGGQIVSVEPSLRADGASVLDASGCYVFPGFIDPHTHFDLRLTTATTADDFTSGTRAAILGGTTTILDFATQDRGMTMHEALGIWHTRANKSSCNYGFHMALSEWNDALCAEMATMREQGVTSYKLYMVYPALRVTDGELYGALKRARELNALVSAHCENWELLQAMTSEQKAQGHFAPFAHPLSRPAENEAEAVNRFLRLAELAEAPAYVVHLSTAEGLLAANMARARGQQVYLETCPQYLLLTDDRYQDADAGKFVMSPPLRKASDNLALFAGLENDLIDTVGTDHCSFTMAQKAQGAGDFTQIPNGSAGVQTRAALYYTYGVINGHLSLTQMAAQLSFNAARLFGMFPQKGLIAPGADADIVIWDPSHEETLCAKTLAHNCDNTPFAGMRVKGRARDVLLNGELVVQNGVLTQPGKGRYIQRGAPLFFRD